MRFGASRTTTLVRWPFSLMLTPLSLMSRSSVPLPVRGHEKVPIGGQVAVPVGGQLKSPLFVRRVVVVEVLPRLTVTVSAITGAAEGDLHCEERGGTDGCDCRLSGCGQLSGCCADLRHYAQDGEADHRGPAGWAGAGSEVSGPEFRPGQGSSGWVGGERRAP